MPEKPLLLDQVRHRLRLKHHSIRTEQAYLQAIKRFSLFHCKRWGFSAPLGELQPGLLD